MPPVQTDFNVTLEAPEKPLAGETMQERAFFFTSKTLAQTPDRETVSCRCFPVHAPLHTLINHAHLSQKGFPRGHRTLTTKVAIAPSVSRQETMSAAGGGTSLTAWCPFARARWSWRSQALKFVKSAMVRRLRRIRTLEVELTRVHGKKTDGQRVTSNLLPSATPQHVPSSAHAHQKQQRATESGAIRTTTCDPINISEWRRVIQEDWTVPVPAT